MKVILRQPRREVEVSGVNSVRKLLDRMGIVGESVLVIRDHELLTPDAVLKEEDVVELRPVISGG